MGWVTVRVVAVHGYSEVAGDDMVCYLKDGDVDDGDQDHGEGFQFVHGISVGWVSGTFVLMVAWGVGVIKRGWWSGQGAGRAVWGRSHSILRPAGLFGNEGTRGCHALPAPIGAWLSGM